MHRLALAFGLLIQLCFPCLAALPVAPNELLIAAIRDLASEDAAQRAAALSIIKDKLTEFPTPDGVRVEWDELKRFQADLRPILPQLVGLLRSKDVEVRSAATSIISCLGTAGAPAVKALIERANDKDEDGHVRLHAATALLFVMPEDMPVLLHLNEAVQSFQAAMKPADVRERDVGLRDTTAVLVATGVARTLASSGHTKCEVPHLVNYVAKNNSVELRLLVLATLCCLESEAKSALPTLWTIVQDERDELREYAAQAIVEIEGEPSQVARVADALEFDATHRAAFVKHVNEIMESRKEDENDLKRNPDIHVPILIATLETGRGPQRRYALRRLGVLGKHAGEAAKEIRKALLDPDVETRELAAEALKRIGGES